MSAEVHTITGQPLGQMHDKKDVRAILQSVIHAIDGGMKIEDIYVIGVVASENDPSLVTHPTWDSGMTIAQVVHLLEAQKHEILTLAQGANRSKG